MRGLEERVEVRSYSGRKYPERPISFIWQDEEHTVEAIEGEWMTPEGSHFQVRTSTGERFHLVYSPEADEWYLRLK